MGNPVDREAIALGRSPTLSLLSPHPQLPFEYSTSESNQLATSQVTVDLSILESFQNSDSPRRKSAGRHTSHARTYCEVKPVI